jgi:hypothetical protein
MTYPAIGVEVFSKSRWWGDGLDQGSSTPLHGAVIEHKESVDPLTGEMVEKVHVVQIYRGAVKYHWFDVEDCDYGASGDLPNKVSLKDLARSLNVHMAKSGSGDHLHALLVLSQVVSGAPSFIGVEVGRGYRNAWDDAG